jgi:hypothetical protein
MSQGKAYGPADLGPDGINSFFQRHRCGQFCNHKWFKPAIVGKAVIPMRQGTSMIAQLPTRQDRNPLQAFVRAFHDPVQDLVVTEYR